MLRGDMYGGHGEFRAHHVGADWLGCTKNVRETVLHVCCNIVGTNFFLKSLFGAISIKVRIDDGSHRFFVEFPI